MLGNSMVVATLPAEDLGRARKFYTEVLGLQEIHLPEVPEEAGMVLEGGDGSLLFVYQRERTKAEHTAVSFYVENFDEVVDGLANKGVVFEQYDLGELKTDERGVATMAEVKMAWLTDPEGNILGLVSKS